MMEKLKGWWKASSTAVKVLIVVGLLAVCASVVYAAYTMTSNPVYVVVQSQATLTLTVEPTTPITLGDNVTLVATCSDASFAGLVAFKDGNGNLLGSDTAISGIAMITWQPSAVGTYTVTATAEHP